MNYRFTLIKQVDELVLTASDWDGRPTFFYAPAKSVE